MVVLAVTSSVLLAAAELGRWAQCETSPVLCVFLFHGLRYQIHCWTRALLPLQLSSYSRLPLRGSLSSQNLSVCHHDPVCLFSGYFCSSVCLLLFLHNLFLFISGFLLIFFGFHLSIVSLQPMCLSLSDLLLAPGRRRRQHKLSLETGLPEDDMHENLRMLITGSKL